MRPGTPPQDTGLPDAVETDPAALNSAEDLDEDQLRVDPLEEGIEPPERWSGADRFGTTAREESTGQDLDHRLAEEEPDVLDAVAFPEPGADETDYRPDADPAADETDYQPDLVVEYRDGEIEYANSADLAEQGAVPRTDAERRGQSADEAGGSVARAIRTPDEETDYREGG